MKPIIHDWDDERADHFEKLRRAMRGPEGKMMLLEMPVGRGNEPGSRKGSISRCSRSPEAANGPEAEFAELLAHAGLRLARVVPTPSPIAVIEAVKA